jgi:hypothetical protein
MGDPVDSCGEFSDDRVLLDIEFPGIIVCFVANSCEANAAMQMVVGKYIIVGLTIIDQNSVAPITLEKLQIHCLASARD